MFANLKELHLQQKNIQKKSSETKLSLGSKTRVFFDHTNIIGETFYIEKGIFFEF